MKMSEVTSAVTRAVNELTDFRAAQVKQTTFSEAVSKTGITEFEIIKQNQLIAIQWTRI